MNGFFAPLCYSRVLENEFDAELQLAARLQGGLVADAIIFINGGEQRTQNYQSANRCDWQKSRKETPHP